MRRALDFVLLLALLAAWGAGSDVARAADLEPLLNSIRSDSSSKVRLQALLILDRRLAMMRTAPPPGAMAVVRTRAQVDDAAVVRAVAARLLGDHGSARDALLLEKMARDSADVVETAAAEALTKLKARLGPSGPRLVWEADPYALPSGDDLSDALRAKVQRHLRGRGEGLRVMTSEEADGPGHWVRFTAEPLTVEPAGDQIALSVTLKVALGQWPERQLRQVLSTRARVRVASVENDEARHARRLLEAAVAQAVAAALKDINGS